MKKKIILSIGIIISVFCVYYIFKTLDIKKAAAVLKSAKYFYIVPALIVYLSSFIVRAIRWRYLLEHHKKIPFTSLFSVLIIGFMANQILPARLGELARGICLGVKENISKSLSIGTIFIERLWDALTLILFLSMLLLFVPTSPLFRHISYIGSLIFLSILVFIVLLTFKKGKCLNFVKAMLKFLPEKILNKLLHILNLFVDGFKVLRQSKHLIFVSLASILIWLIEILAYYILSFAFSLNIPIYSIALVLILLNVGVMIPSSPGYVGTFEFFCIKGLSFFNIPEEVAFGYAIVLHIMMSVPIIIFGLLLLWKEGMSLTEIQNQSADKN